MPAHLPLTRTGRRRQKSPSRCIFSADDLRSCRPQKVENADARRASADRLLSRWLHANPRHPAVICSATSGCWCKPGPPGLARKVGQASACHPPASACHPPARHKMCATAGKRRKKIREPESPRSRESTILRSSYRSWSGCTLDGCVRDKAGNRQLHCEQSVR